MLLLPVVANQIGVYNGRPARKRVILRLTSLVADNVPKYRIGSFGLVQFRNLVQNVH